MFIKVCRSFGLSVGIAVVPCVGMCPLCLTDGAPESHLFFLFLALIY